MNFRDRKLATCRLNCPPLRLQSKTNAAATYLHSNTKAATNGQEHTCTCCKFLLTHQSSTIAMQLTEDSKLLQPSLDSSISIVIMYNVNVAKPHCANNCELSAYFRWQVCCNLLYTLFAISGFSGSCKLFPYSCMHVQLVASACTTLGTQFVEEQ